MDLEKFRFALELAKTLVSEALVIFGPYRYQELSPDLLRNLFRVLHIIMSGRAVDYTNLFARRVTQNYSSKLLQPAPRPVL